MARWSTCLRAPVYEIVRLRPIKNKANTSRVANRWGEDVACLVDEVTDDMSLDETTRKRKQVETASKKSSRAKVLKLADKTAT
jgi:(p)ppGpp synthase/HD superfamily hydrolase